MDRPGESPDRDGKVTAKVEVNPWAVTHKDGHKKASTGMISSTAGDYAAVGAAATTSLRAAGAGRGNSVAAVGRGVYTPPPRL